MTSNPNKQANCTCLLYFWELAAAEAPIIYLCAYYSFWCLIADIKTNNRTTVTGIAIKAQYNSKNVSSQKL